MNKINDKKLSNGNIFEHVGFNTPNDEEKSTTNSGDENGTNTFVHSSNCKELACMLKNAQQKLQETNKDNALLTEAITYLKKKHQLLSTPCKPSTLPTFVSSPSSSLLNNAVISDPTGNKNFDISESKLNGLISKTPLCNNSTCSNDSCTNVFTPIISSKSFTPTKNNLGTIDVSKSSTSLTKSLPNFSQPYEKNQFSQSEIDAIFKQHKQEINALLVVLRRREKQLMDERHEMAKKNKQLEEVFSIMIKRTEYVS